MLLRGRHHRDLLLYNPAGLCQQRLFLLVVGASGLCTPGPVRNAVRTACFALPFRRGIRQPAPAQVTACRVVTPRRIVNEVLGGGYYRCKCPNSRFFAYTGPFLGPLAKTAPSRNAVMFNEQILAEAEPELIWTDQT